MADSRDVMTALEDDTGPRVTDIRFRKELLRDRGPMVGRLANGYHDLATPFGSTEHTFDHLGFEPGYRDRVTMAYHEAGHMMYIRPTMLEPFKKDVAAFME